MAMSTVVAAAAGTATTKVAAAAGTVTTATTASAAVATAITTTRETGAAATVAAAAGINRISMHSRCWPLLVVICLGAVSSLPAEEGPGIETGTPAPPPAEVSVPSAPELELAAAGAIPEEADPLPPIAVAESAGDPRWVLHANGYTIHFNKKPKPGEEVNDFLYGLGFHYEWARGPRHTWAAEFDAFNDSHNELSLLGGASGRYDLGPVEIGATGMLMYKSTFSDDEGTPVLPLLIPFVQKEFNSWGIRMYYVPPVRKPTDHQITFQLHIPL